jgi:hypothetical protein
MSIEEVQRLLLEQDIPNEIAKELAVTILSNCFSAAAATIHLFCSAYIRSANSTSKRSESLDIVHNQHGDA